MMDSPGALVTAAAGPCCARRRASLLMLVGLGPALVRAGTPAAPPGGAGGVDRAESAVRAAMSRAFALRDEAVRAGDQPYGAVVLCGERIVGAAPSQVVTAQDPSAHAETQAIRDAVRNLGRDALTGCWLISSSRPCRACETRAWAARIERMIHGDALTDAGAPT